MESVSSAGVREELGCEAGVGFPRLERRRDREERPRGQEAKGDNYLAII